MSSDVLSPVIKLNPGFTYKGQRITEAQVRLLNRADRKAIARRAPEEQDEAFLLRSIVSFGQVKDRTEIASAFEYLLAPDEERITRALNALQAQFADAPEPEQPKVKRVVLATDLLSKPFGLSPGINIAGIEIKSCVVRLLRRGELKQLDAVADPVEQSDLSLWMSVVQFGDITDVTREHIDMLAAVDEERIQREIAELQDSFRDGPKHTCPECGHKF
jgi:hypothetical protein